ncbi:MAG: helix-turn-helix transcriptional regulator [Alphaproteobacteria bacterium]|nr:helix-turn-helix transcriptional regulator [Alphaproteobacteria bacterium]
MSAENDIFFEQIGVNIRTYRKSKHLTQEQIASKLQMTVTNYSIIERGKIGTTLTTLFKIAKILEVSPTQLILGKDEIFLTKSDIVKLYAEEIK